MAAYRKRQVGGVDGHAILFSATTECRTVTADSPSDSQYQVRPHLPMGVWLMLEATAWISPSAAPHKFKEGK